MKNWKLLLAGLLTFIASVLGGGYSGSVTAESVAAKSDALPAETYGTAYSDGKIDDSARTIADYDVDVYWGLIVENEANNALPGMKFQVPYYARHTVRIANGITDDKVRAALEGKAPFQNSKFLLVWNSKIVRWIKREADAGGKTKYEPEVK